MWPFRRNPKEVEVGDVVLAVKRGGLDAARAIYATNASDPRLLCALADALGDLHDIRYLNAESPADPLFAVVADALLPVTESSDRTLAIRALHTLASLSRLLGRSRDAITERAALAVVAADPARWESHYDLGLFYKTRGRFAEGLSANQRAAELGGAACESVVWNLGICATGAGDGATALRVWKGMRQKVDLGRFGLPEGRYPSCKVRVAQRPLAERDLGQEPDDPGSEETIWIERLSPCHGVIRSALFSDAMRIDYGDVILFDGAPITHHKYEGEDIPVFPHLATLRRSGHRIFPFHGTQPHQGLIAAMSEGLPADAVLYVHTEQFTSLCRACWENPGLDHTHGSPRGDHRVVTGKLCSPPEVSPSELLRSLDDLLVAKPDVRILVPALARAAGEHGRAEAEERRVAMITAAVRAGRKGPR